MFSEEKKRKRYMESKHAVEPQTTEYDENIIHWHDLLQQLKLCVKKLLFCYTRSFHSTNV